MSFLSERIYLKVAHVDDDDADYFVFPNLDSALSYIHNEDITELVMSDIIFEEMPECDYTDMPDVAQLD